MPTLKAVRQPPGPEFVSELARVWSAGDAAFCVDCRLPLERQDALCQAMRVGDDVAEDDALVVATSGSTGVPKGVVLTHEALSSQAHAVHRRLEVDRNEDRWVACLPLAHIGGLGVVVRALIDDIALQLLPAYDDTRVDGTLISLVPTVLDRLETRRVAAFRWIVLGGSGDHTHRPDNVVRTWGMTESGGGVVYGDTPLDNIDVRSVDGELQLRGPSLLRCYRDGTDPKDANGWYSTGDLGSVDDDGRVQVEGRRDHLIISGGENIWPEPVEAVLAKVQGIADVAITAREDREWGQRVVALVVPTDPGDPPTLAHLRDAVSAELPRYAAPRELQLVESIPRTALGKVQRSAL